MGIWQIVRRQVLEMQETNPNIKIPAWLESYCNRRRGAMFGPKNHNCKGGRLRRDGYILVNKRDHRFADKRGYVKEHRLVWEQHNHACLLPCAHVHHKNYVKHDNRIENLEAMMHRDHTRMECLKLKPWRFRMKQKPLEEVMR